MIIFHVVISVAPSPMGGLFATGSGDMRARIWRLVPPCPKLFNHPSVIDMYRFTPPKWGLERVSSSLFLSLLFT
ncbi:hypothetical protein EV426DRAFT_419131 [Tirmania nivea]|nr:hypothetical protein EV426DRAFT_419131 [Tirmania nivea]